MTIINPALSFVQFNEADPGDCLEDVNPCLPVMEVDDLKFQIRASTPSSSEASAIVASNTSLILSLVDTDGELIKDFSTDGFYFERYKTEDKKVLFYWPHGLPGLEELVACDTCFRLKISSEGAGAISQTSNLFCRVCGDCYTSVLEYSCDEDAFDFTYCNYNAVNRVRLPLFVNRPQFQDEESVYVRSNGSRKLLKSISKKEYEGWTEMLPAGWHEKIKHALSSDNVYINSKHYAGGISKSGAYEVQWPEFMDYLTAGATFKVLATPYSWRNSNCVNCEPYEAVCEVILESFIVFKNEGGYFSFTWEVVEPGNTYLVEYSSDNTTWHELAVLTTENSAIAEEILPGNDYFFRITPICENSAAGTPSIRHYTAEGGGGLPGGGPECVNVSIAEGDELPQGTGGIAYSHDVVLAGTEPFALANIVKPDWMTIEVSGNVVTISGTAEVGEFAVSFDVTNCSSGSVSFTHTLTVIAAPTLMQVDNAISGTCQLYKLTNETDETKEYNYKECGSGNTSITTEIAAGEEQEICAEFYPSAANIDVELLGNCGNTKRTQVFEVGQSVMAGNVFSFQCYGHTVSVAAVGGDTSETIAVKLANAINTQSEANWNSAGNAPGTGTAGFPPLANAYYSQVSITLDAANQFTSSTTV